MVSLVVETAFGEVAGRGDAVEAAQRRLIVAAACKVVDLRQAADQLNQDVSAVAGWSELNDQVQSVEHTRGLHASCHRYVCKLCEALKREEEQAAAEVDEPELDRIES